MMRNVTMSNGDILNGLLECSKKLSSETRKPRRPFCITTANDADYVFNWVKKYHIPFNGLFLTKDVCDYIDKLYNDIFNGDT